jgi:hypothetical protein
MVPKVDNCSSDRRSIVEQQTQAPEYAAPLKYWKKKNAITEFLLPVHSLNDVASFYWFYETSFMDGLLLEIVARDLNWKA